MSRSTLFPSRRRIARSTPAIRSWSPLTIAAIAGLSALLFLLPVSALAQGSDGPVRIVLVNDLSVPQARAEVVRLAGGRDPDIILLRASNATIEDLGGALAALRRMRRTSAPADRHARATITGAVPSGPIPEARRAALARALDAARAAPLTDIAPIGKGRWVEFASPSLTR